MVGVSLITEKASSLELTVQCKFYHLLGVSPQAMLLKYCWAQAPFLENGDSQAVVKTNGDRIQTAKFPDQFYA